MRNRPARRPIQSASLAGSADRPGRRQRFRRDLAIGVALQIVALTSGFGALPHAPFLTASIGVVAFPVPSLLMVAVKVPWSIALALGIPAQTWAWLRLVKWLESRRVSLSMAVFVVTWSMVSFTSLTSMLGTGDPARQSTCDDVYTALSDEAKRELVTAIRNEGGGMCGAMSTSEVVSCLLGRHTDEDNPRNRKQAAYTAGPPAACQVQIEAEDARTIRFSQPTDASGAIRSHSIRVD